VRETHAFRFKIRSELSHQYIQRHMEVWPDIREGLRSCGWENYQLFFDQETSTVFGYLESTNLQQSFDCARELPSYKAWQRDMEEFFDRKDGESDETFFQNLVCVFRLSEDSREAPQSTWLNGSDDSGLVS
jgi:L-rhamnose mutarotase